MNTRASSINRALDQIGDKWCLLIMQQIFLGINSFNDMLEATGASRGVLSDRLKWLESVDCLEKALSTGSRRCRYYLTEKSRDLYANALMALAWETSYGNSAIIEATQLVHRNCGERCTPRMQCRACQQSIQADDVSYRPGPGATEDQRLKKVRRRSSISAIDAATARS